MSATDELHVRITIEYLPFMRMWSWTVNINRTEWSGYEHDYLNAEGQVADILDEQGVER